MATATASGRASLMPVAVRSFPELLRAGELEIRLDEGLVLADGRPLTLSVREFELLAAMATRCGSITTREELHTQVWGTRLRPGSRSVDVYVSKLRGKLEAAVPARRFIHTHQGFGYRFEPEDARVHAAERGSPGDPVRLRAEADARHGERLTLAGGADRFTRSSHRRAPRLTDCAENPGRGSGPTAHPTAIENPAEENQ